MASAPKHWNVSLFVFFSCICCQIFVLNCTFMNLLNVYSRSNEWPFVSQAIFAWTLDVFLLDHLNRNEPLFFISCYICGFPIWQLKLRYGLYPLIVLLTLCIPLFTLYIIGAIGQHSNRSCVVLLYFHYLFHWTILVSPSWCFRGLLNLKKNTITNLNTWFPPLWTMPQNNLKNTHGLNNVTLERHVTCG